MVPSASALTISALFLRAFSASFSRAFDALPGRYIALLTLTIGLTPRAPTLSIPPLREFSEWRRLLFHSPNPAAAHSSRPARRIVAVIGSIRYWSGVWREPSM